jgi:hypothetical protein
VSIGPKCITRSDAMNALQLSAAGRVGKGRQAVPTDPIGRSSRLRHDVGRLCGLAMFRYIQYRVGTLRFAHPTARLNMP